VTHGYFAGVDLHSNNSYIAIIDKKVMNAAVNQVFGWY
jgi:hypothetical protein